MPASSGGELSYKAVGPDIEEITIEECERRLAEILADTYYGEQGYRVAQHIDKLLRGDKK